MGQGDFETNYTKKNGPRMISSGQAIEPYYDTKLRPSTPTMVSNFVLPNSTINKNGPFLEVQKQPQSKFRFRYLSEMGGTHGQLKAESAERSKSDYPTVKLCNWEGGPALVQLQLYTADPNANDRKKHVHELNGKNVNKSGITGGCEVVVDDSNNYTASFPNLGIIHIAKRDVGNIIYQRKRQEKINASATNTNVKHNISPTEICKLKEDANEEARSMDLNKVVLRFQAFFFDETVGQYVPITDHIDSEVIFNLKNAQTGELKIVRLSSVAAPCTGGTEVWMLVEKVKKDNVKVKFYECDYNGQEIWKAYGEFKGSDVHHQYAIVFKTPPYRFSTIREPVQIKIQLERPSDGDTSDTIDFQYTPEVLKRSIPFDDHNQRTDTNPYKRQRNIVEPVNLKTNTGKLFLGSGERETSRQSPSHMVPSPIGFISSPSSQEFYSPQHPSPQSVHHGFNDDIHFSGHPDIIGSGYSPSFEHIDTQHHQAYDNSIFPYKVEETQGQNYSMKTQSPINITPPHSTSFSQLLSPEARSPSYGSKLLSLDARSPSYGYKQEVPALSPQNNQMSPSAQFAVLSPYSQEATLSPYGGSQSGNGNYNSQSHSPIYNLTQDIGSHDTILENLTNVTNVTDTAPEQIKQCDAVIEQVISRHNVVSNNNADFSNLLSAPIPSTQIVNCDLFEFMTNNGNMFVAPPSFHAAIQADCHPSKNSRKIDNPESLIKSPEQVGKARNDGITLGSSDTNKKTIIIKNTNIESPNDLIISSNLKEISMKLSAPDTDLGFISEKMASIHIGRNDENKARNTENSIKNVELIKASDKSKHQNVNKVTDKVENIKIEDKIKIKDIKNASEFIAVNSCNSALNIAVRAADGLRDYAATGDIGPLLATHKYLLAVQNSRGDNSLHCAVASGNYNVFKKVLTASLELSIGDILKSRNFYGETPLHVAATTSNIYMVRDILASTGCDITIRDMAGNTPLHIASGLEDDKCLEMMLTDTVCENESNVATVINAYNYSGETPLHKAVLLGNLKNIKNLLAHGANVHLRERKRGANPLHLAVINGLVSVGNYLTAETDIDVGAGMFDGNTALHIAAQSKLVEFCKLLINVKANPYATNALCKPQKENKNSKQLETQGKENENEDSDDSEVCALTDEEDSEDCYTPMDYAEGDREILSILKEESTELSKEVGRNKMDSGIEITV